MTAWLIRPVSSHKSAMRGFKKMYWVKSNIACKPGISLVATSGIHNMACRTSWKAILLALCTLLLAVVLKEMAIMMQMM